MHRVESDAICSGVQKRDLLRAWRPLIHALRRDRSLVTAGGGGHTVRTLVYEEVVVIAARLPTDPDLNQLARPIILGVRNREHISVTVIRRRYALSFSTLGSCAGSCAYKSH